MRANMARTIPSLTRQAVSPCEGDLGHQFQGPHTRLLLIVARALVRESQQPLGRGCVEAITERVRAPWALPQHPQLLAVEGMNHLTYGLPAQADGRGDPAYMLPTGTGQQDLGAAEDKGVRRASRTWRSASVKKRTYSGALP